MYQLNLFLYSQCLLYTEKSCSAYTFPHPVKSVHLAYSTAVRQNGRFSAKTLVQLSCLRGLFENETLPEIKCVKGNWTNIASSIPPCCKYARSFSSLSGFDIPVPSDAIYCKPTSRLCSYQSPQSTWTALSIKLSFIHNLHFKGWI